MSPDNNSGFSGLLTAFLLNDGYASKSLKGEEMIKILEEISGKEITRHKKTPFDSSGQPQITMDDTDSLF